MNISMPPENPRLIPFHPEDPYPRQAEEPGSPGEFNLGEVLANLWDGKWIILGSVALFVILGLYYVLTASPVYQVEGLLQTETQKNYGAQPTEFTKMEGVYSAPTIAQGEIEIVKSNMVLGKVVETLGLDVVARPVLPPVVGKLIYRDRTQRPRMEVESFEVPTLLRGKKFEIVVLPGADGYVWKSPEGAILGRGTPGTIVKATYKGQPLSLMVKSLRGKPGQVFTLTLTPMLDAITNLRLALTVEERGRNAYVSSNILGLTLQAPDPDRGAEILNEILNQYVRQTIQRKSGDSAKALALLQSQRPMLQAQLSEAESRLNEFRRQNGAVDTAREGEMYLQESSTLDSQITALKQKRQELLRTYTERSDQVTTVDQQIAHLQGEVRKVDSKVTALPRTQQEVVRLTRDAQVKSDLYTSLLSSIQQLQNTLAGSVGNARVLDYAIPDYDAVAPKKKVLMALFLFMGVVAGVGLTLVRRMLRKGIEDHRIIESKLSLPILVTIPHTESQKVFDRDIRRRAPGLHLLAIQDPEDMATESLRSLRTVLHFTMENASNRLVLITGPSPDIGKSFVSTNLATVLAQGGSKVLLVDADLRRGNLHRVFGIKGRAGGLSEVLSGRADWRAIVKPTEVPGLSFISTGVLPPDPLVLLMSQAFSEFTAQISDAFDFAVIDAPPILPVTDAIVIGSKTDSILMVAKYGAHPLDELRTCLTRMKNLTGRLKGCVFNDIKLVGVSGLYGYYKYEFDYKYRRGEG